MADFLSAKKKQLMAMGEKGVRKLSSIFAPTVEAPTGAEGGSIGFADPLTDIKETVGRAGTRVASEQLGGEQLNDPTMADIGGKVAEKVGMQRKTGELIGAAASFVPLALSMRQPGSMKATGRLPYDKPTASAFKDAQLFVPDIKANPDDLRRAVTSNTARLLEVGESKGFDSNDIRKAVMLGDELATKKISELGGGKAAGYLQRIQKDMLSAEAQRVRRKAVTGK